MRKTIFFSILLGALAVSTAAIAQVNTSSVCHPFKCHPIGVTAGCVGPGSCRQ